MKVYIVIGNNKDYENNYTWNDAVFTSREAAEEYIKHQLDIFRGEMNRLEELMGKINYTYTEEELSEEERAEEFLHNRWDNRWVWASCCPIYEIEEFEVFG